MPMMESLESPRDQEWGEVDSEFADIQSEFDFEVALEPGINPYKEVDDYIFNTSRKDAIDESYELLDVLGSGAFGVVRACIHRETGIKRAVKIINKQAKIDVSKLRVEVTVLLSVNHPHIVNLEAVYETKTHIYVVMEYAGGGELFDRIVEKGPYTERDAADAIQQLLAALVYLHTSKIVHRDIKPENILYSDMTPEAVVKLADFGMAEVLSDKALLHEMCGTPGYVAPEVLMGLAYDTAVDMWSLGVVAYVILSGCEPFRDKDEFKTYRRITHCEFHFPEEVWGSISDEARNFICRLLVKDPSERLTAGQALRHPWIRGVRPSLVYMNQSLENLRRLNARRKMKRAILTVTAAARLSHRSSAARVNSHGALAEVLKTGSGGYETPSHITAKARSIDVVSLAQRSMSHPEMPAVPVNTEQHNDIRVSMP
eukprot:Colp12_sorted_trinity150504_noHs@29329